MGPEGKQKWETFCVQHGQGTFDPSRHSEETLKFFFESVEFGETPTNTEHTQEDFDHVEVPMLGQQENFAAKSELDASFDATTLPEALNADTPVSMLDEYLGMDKASLAAEVKRLQKTDLNMRQQWVVFCETQGGGTLDPSRHREESLQAFFAGVGIGSM